MALASPASARASLSLVAGYGLYKAVSSTGYLSAMGTAEGNLGFVSQLPFMMANCLAEAVVSLAIALLAIRGRLAPGRLPHGLGYALLALATLASAASAPLATMLGPGASELGIPIALGLVKGAGSIAVSLGWFELYVACAGTRALWLLLGAFGVGAIGGLGLSALPDGGGARALSLLLYAISFACSYDLTRHREALGGGDGGAAGVRLAGGTKEGCVEGMNLAPEQAPLRRLRLGSVPGRRLVSVWLCLLVAQFVVGVTNTAVFESSFAPIMAQVNVNVCILVVVAVLAVVWRLTRRVPRPQTAFGIVMPLLLAAFTLAALAAERFGVVMGYAMIACYEAIAVTYTIYLVTFLQEGHYEPYRILGLASGTMSLALLLGLALGVGLTVLCDTHDLPLFTLLAFVAIYPIGLALLWMQRTRERDGQGEAGAGAAGAPGTGGEAGAGAARASGGASGGTTSGTGGNHSDAGEAQAVGTSGSEAAGTPERTTHADVEDYRADVIARLAERFGLTPREAQVCAQLARGHTVRGIAEELGITENTAWTHVRNTYAKCGVRTKQELIELFEATRP